MATLEKKETKVTIFYICLKLKNTKIVKKIQKQKNKGNRNNAVSEEENETFAEACSKLVSYDCAVSKEFQTVQEEDFDIENDEIPCAPTLEDFIADFAVDNDPNESTSKSLKEELLNEELEEVVDDYEEDELVVEPWTSKFEASAPEQEQQSTILLQPEIEPIVQYPSLSSLRLTEQSTHPAGTNSRFITKPKAFTSEQLKEFYYCKELDNVRQFETYFLQHNLHFPYENEPLYVMLQALSLLRGKVKMNLLDLKKYQQNFRILSEDIWVTKTVHKKFEAMCADGALMSISKDFE